MGTRFYQSSTVHYTVLYRSYKFWTRALTLRLCFSCLKIINSISVKLEVKIKHKLQ